MAHAKVMATSILCLALVVSVFVYSKRSYVFGQSAPQPAPTVSVVSAVTPQTATDDSWKQTLTDSATVDSPIQVITPTSTTDTALNNTLTAQVAQNFFALYLQDQKNGVTIDDTEAANIADQTLSNVTVTTQPKQYSDSDVKITGDSSDQSMHQYEQEIVDATKNNSPQNYSASQNELTIISKAMQSGSYSDLQALNPIIDAYQKIIQATLKVVVPEKALGYHMVYLNTLSAILFDIQGMQDMFTDPAMGYYSFSNYQKDTVKLGIVIQEAQKAFP